MKKVLLISESLGGGLRKHIVQLIENLDKEKFELYLIHGTSSVDGTFLEVKEELAKHCKFIPYDGLVREITIKKDALSIFFVINQIKKIKPDIVHCHSSKAGVIGRVSAKVCRVKKCYYTPHAYSFLAPEFSSNKKKIFVLIERFLSRYATTKTFTVSEGEKRAALSVNIDNTEKISVIYNGLSNKRILNKTQTKEKLGFYDNNFVIGNTARLNAQKDPFTFIEIAKNIIEENPNVFFVWVGDGPLKEKVEKLIKTYTLQKNVKLLGHRTDSDEIVAAYDLFLTTSLYEGLPYSPIEALRAGVPVLATDVTGNNEIVDDDTNGKIITGDIVNNATKIITEIINGEIKINYSDVISSFYSKFSLDGMIKKISEEYEK